MRDEQRMGRWPWVGAVMVAVGLLVNLPIGVLMIVSDEPWRGALQLAVACSLVYSGTAYRRARTRGAARREKSPEAADRTS
jgi:hypothetical protein